MSFTKRYYIKSAGPFKPDMGSSERTELFKPVAHYFHHKYPELNEKLVWSIGADFKWPETGKLYIRDSAENLIEASNLVHFFQDCYPNWCFDLLDNAYVILEKSVGHGPAYDFENRVNQRLRMLNIKWQMSRGDWYKLDVEFFEKHLKT